MARSRLQPPPACDAPGARRRAAGGGARCAAAAAAGALRLVRASNEPGAARRLPAPRRLLLPGAGAARARARRASLRPRPGLDLSPQRRGRPLPAQLRAGRLAAAADYAARAAHRAFAGVAAAHCDAAGVGRLHGAVRVSPAKAKTGERLPYLLGKLKAPRVLERLEQTAALAREQEWPYERFLETLLEAEVFARDASGARMRVSAAGFPALKTSRTSTGARNPRRRSRSCCTSRSSPGSRSAPTSASSARPAPARPTSRSRSPSKACEHGHRVAFATAQDWVSRLEAAQDRNQLEAELRRLERYDLLVVDEVGYLPLERQAANLLFALVSRRYERGSIAVTSNRGFEQWGEILGDAMVAAALIDRLVHHATMITLKGKSYRLRERGLDVTAAAQAPSLRDSA